ncbi:MAG: cyanophycin synthetase [Patescibacteria group bacterium]
MMKKFVNPLGLLLKRIAPQIGAQVFLEEEWGVAGQIVFKNGTKSYFRYTTLDVNPMGASAIAKDKGFAKYFMARMGYPTVEGQTFYSPRWNKAIKGDRSLREAREYAMKLGYPVIVKPNAGSKGKGVAKVYSDDELRVQLKEIFRDDNVAIVERPVLGKDYRIVVLDGRVISAYERMPLKVVGDGVYSIYELLNAKQEVFIRDERDTVLLMDDDRMHHKLARAGLSMQSVPEAGAHIFLLDNANLSSGGDSRDVTHEMHASYASLAVRVTRDMGLRMCGVDLMINGDITREAEHWILEINSAPGLDHYAHIGREQEKIVEELYLEVLKSLEKTHA